MTCCRYQRALIILSIGQRTDFPGLPTTSYRSTFHPETGLFPVRAAVDESACQAADVELALIHLQDWCVHCNCPNTTPASSWFSRVLHSRLTFVTSWTQISCSEHWQRRDETWTKFLPFASQLCHQHVCVSWWDTWRVSEEERGKCVEVKQNETRE